MKIMAASDIHGSVGGLEKILSAFRREEADKLLLLGDILYHGPRNDIPDDYDPKAVISVLNGMRDKILCVCGNCDAMVDRMVLKFPLAADYVYLVSGGQVVLATHGHIYSPDNIPVFLNKGDVFLYGHTHITRDETVDGIRYLNPGSASIPKDGTIPSYVIIDEGDVSLHAL